jgi:hypothetical protein
MNDPFWRLPVVPSFTVTSTDVTDGQGAASGTDVWHLRGSRREGRLAPAVVVRRSPGNQEFHRDHVRPRCPQRVRFLALGRRRYPRLGDRTPDRSGGRHRRAAASRSVPYPQRRALGPFVGGAPPPGDARHRYVIVVQALGIEKVGQLQVQADSTPAWLGFSINVSGHLLGRAVITPWAELPAA